MNIVAVMVVKSTGGIDAYYVDMAIKSLLPYVSGIYVQDQGSTDNCMNIIKETVDGKVPLIIEEEVNPYPRFDVRYDETVYRNKAIERCETLFPDAEFILQNDCDDLFLPEFFDRIFELNRIRELEGINSFYYATERFITPTLKSGWRGDIIEFGGKYLHDPHYKVWRADLKLRYPVAGEGHFHNIPKPDPLPSLIMDGLYNIHLHRTFGPKAFQFWREGGDVFEETVPFNPRKQAPKKFTGPQNMGSAVKVDFKWPSYILDKWLAWGQYD